MCSQAQKEYHCFHAMLSLQGIEADIPSVTDLWAALYVAMTSLWMSIGISTRAWTMKRKC